jgi:hypothetical protein
MEESSNNRDKVLEIQGFSQLEESNSESTVFSGSGNCDPNSNQMKEVRFQQNPKSPQY